MAYDPQLNDELKRQKISDLCGVDRDILERSGMGEGGSRGLLIRTYNEAVAHRRNAFYAKFSGYTGLAVFIIGTMNGSPRSVIGALVIVLALDMLKLGNRASRSLENIGHDIRTRAIMNSDANVAGPAPNCELE